MRVLFTTWAWPSHLYALVPLARACRDAGHEVLVASQPRLVREIGRCGLLAAGTGRDVDTVGMVRGYLTPDSVSSRSLPRAVRMLLAHAESMVDDLIELAHEWRADAIVYETTTLAGPIAAAAAGVPAIRHLYGPDLLLQSRAVLANALAPLAEQRGVGEFDPFGVVTVDPVPDDLQLTTSRARLPMRYTPFNGPGHAPALPERSDRSRVCVTWGHTIATVDPGRFFLPSVLDALDTMNVEVVAAVSAEQVRLLGPVRSRARVVVDAPLQHVLTGCDAVVAHGGAATSLTALTRGLPLVLLPQLPDHIAHAERVAASGAGELLPICEAEPQRVRELVTGLLGGSPYRTAALRIRRAMLNTPSPAAVLDVLTNRIAELSPR